MDTPAPTADSPPLPPHTPGYATAYPAGALAAEIRHSVLLLGGALGLMGSFAALLLLLTTRLGS
jgi:hypothetical protein